MNELDPREEADNGYKEFRGRCKELSEAAVAADPSLTLVRGHYFCPIWNSDQAHWWTTRADGTIYDPTASQFPSKGHGIYTPFDGVFYCEECGKEMQEDEIIVAGNYPVCSDLCYGRLVGVFL